MAKRKNGQKKTIRFYQALSRTKHVTIEQIVYVAFGIFLFTTLIGHTVIPQYSQIVASLSDFLRLLKYSCCIIFLYKAYTDIKRDGKIPISVIIFAILSMLSFVFSQIRNLLLLFCALVGLRKMNLSKLIKIAYYISMAVFLFTISSSLLGIVPNWAFGRQTLDGKAIIRNSLGFVYATDCISIYLSAILMYFYLKRSNAKFFEIILLQILNLFLYKATDGRVSFILITGLLTILAASKIPQLGNTNIKNKCINKIGRISQTFQQKVAQNHFIQTITKTICYILPTTLFIIYNSLSIAYINNPQSVSKINDLLSSRLEYTARAYENYQVPIFGKNIRWQGWGGYGYNENVNIENFQYNFVDTSYARLVFDYGIIYTIAILFAYTYSLIYYLKKKDYWTVSTIFFILIWSFIEPYMFDITRNPLIILLIPTLRLGPSLRFKKQKTNQLAG